jgi:fructuronate reductase
MDGSYKLPQRLLATARDTLASGRQPRLVALAVAGWIRYLGGLNEAGDRYDVLDPMADRLVSIATSAAPSEAVAARLLAIREVFGDDLAGAAPFRASVGAWLRRLHEDGVVRTVAHAVSEPA